MKSEADIINKWYDIGLELLDSDNGALDVIKANYPNDNEKCCIRNGYSIDQMPVGINWLKHSNTTGNPNSDTTGLESSR